MRRLGIVFVSLAVALALAWAPTAQAQQQTIVIKFSHVVAKEAPKGKAADRFAELVNQRLKGRVEVQVFHNSSLYKDREEIEALQLGAVQMLAPSTAKLVPWFPQYQVFDLPYLFVDQDHAYRAMTDARVTAKLFPLLKGRQMLGLAAWDNGFKHMTSNKCPIVKPEDLKGQKIRVQSSKVLEEQFRTATSPMWCSPTRPSGKACPRTCARCWRTPWPKSPSGSGSSMPGSRKRR